MLILRVKSFKILPKKVMTSLNIWKEKGKVTEKELKYFIINTKKGTNLGKMYLLSKIYKRLYYVPGRPGISDCGTSIEKVSEFLDNQLKSVMWEGRSYIKDWNDFMHKIRDLQSINQSINHLFILKRKDNNK